MESRGLRVAKAACEGFFRRDRVAPAYGIALQEIEVDRVVLSMPVREEMINSTEVCHGGILFLFADVIFGYACRTRNMVGVGIQCGINYLAPAKLGEILVGEGRVQRSGRSTGVVDVTIRNPAGKEVVLFRGTFYRYTGHVVDPDTVA